MGVFRCCVVDCVNFHSPWRVEGPSPSYHRFPIRNEHRAAWIEFAARGRGWQPTASTFVCSNHFRPEDYLADSSDRFRRLRTNVIPTIRPAKRILPEKRTLPPQNNVQDIPEKQTLPPRVVARMQRVLQATVKYTDAPPQDGDFRRDEFLPDCLSPSPSISASEEEDDEMPVAEHDPPATEIRFTYSILRSGLALVSLPSGWNTFMDDDDFVMFFRIDKASYEITHAVYVAANLVPKIRIHNLLYSGNEFGRIPLENFWCLKELLLSLSCATICPGLESNFDGGCALVFKGGAALCPACKARKRLADQRARNNADKEPEDDSSVRKYIRRKKRRVEESFDRESLDVVVSNNEVGLPEDGIPFDENKEGLPLGTSKRRRRRAKITKSLNDFTDNLENCLPVEPWFGIPEALPLPDNASPEETGYAGNVVEDSSDFSAAVPIQHVDIMSDVQKNELYCPVEEENKILKSACHLCGFVPERPKTGLTQHIRRAHPECAAQWTVECTYCGRKCPSETSLKIHVKAVHKDGAVLTLDPAAVETAIEYMKTTGRFSYYCVPCHRHYISKAVFDLHQFQHSPPDTSTDQSQRDCPACDFHAPTFPDLVAHMSKHALRHNEKKPCLICGRYYLGHSRTHYRNCHPEEISRAEADWTEQCGECGEKFKWKRMLGFHKRAVHEGFQCLYCAKRYYRTKEFGEHVLEHKVDGVFPCSLCDKKCAFYPLLAAHYRSYHDITRAQHCTVCRNVIPGGKKQLSAHMERCNEGKPFQPHQRGKHREMEAAVRAKFKGVTKGQRLPCDHCGQLLASAVSMSKHIRWVHIGDLKEQFEKDREEKRKQGIYVYSQRGYVKPRDRIALEDFPHRCDECQLGFIKEISLIKHRDTRHPEKFVE